MRAIVLAGLVVAGLAAQAEPAGARVCKVSAVPAATLLLPYFEIDLDHPNSLTTSFSVNNASATAVLAHVVVWSDLAVPVIAFNIYLTGYDVQTVNLRDIVVRGVLPATASAGQDPADTISPKGSVFSQDINFGSCTGQLPPAALPPSFLDHLQQSLTGGPSQIFNGKCSGQALGDHIARGYVTIDTVNNCTLRYPADAGYFGAGGTGDVTNQNVLWGDFQILDATQAFAESGTLVHILADAADPATSTPGRYTFYGRYVGWTAIDNREPLSTTFATRYLSGGAFTGGTSLLVWRDSKVDQEPFDCPVAASIRPAWYPLDLEGDTIFDEQEHPAIITFGFPGFPQPRLFPFPAATQRVFVNGAVLPVPFSFGWLRLDLNTPGIAPGSPPIDPQAAQAWVVTLMEAHGYAASTEAIRLDSACGAQHFVP